MMLKHALNIPEDAMSSRRKKKRGVPENRYHLPAHKDASEKAEEPCPTDDATPTVTYDYRKFKPFDEED